MCAIGRALMANPSMVLLDEPSMGLAPQIVEEVFEIVKDLNTKEQVTFLLAEQNTNMALNYADYGYIMESGRVVMDGPAADLATNEDVKEFYLGVGGGERKSFRDVKSYKRRKRWLACRGQRREATGMNDQHYDRPGNPRDPRASARADGGPAGAGGACAAGSAAFAEILAGVDAAAVISSREALARLPVTRKHELLERQKAPQADPFGGFPALVRAPAMPRVFASPGTIYDPRAARDYWRRRGRCSPPASAPATWCTTASATT